MTVRKLTARQEKVRSFLVDGYTIRQTAGWCKLTYHQVRHIADNLVYLGYITRRKDVGTAVLFNDARLPPKGGIKSGNNGNGGSVFSRHTGVTDTEGHTFRESRVHLNGEILYNIRNIGQMEDIKDNAGFVMGYWSGVGKPKGRTDYKGYANIDGVRLTFAYRKGNKGSNTLAVWPQDVWTQGPNAMTTGEEILKGRATRLTELLYGLGWRFYEQDVRGTFESGHVNDPRVARMKKDHVDTDATVKADTSPKIPEIEVNENDANDILSYTPEHIVTLYNRSDELAAKETRLRHANRLLRIEILESENFLLERDRNMLEIMRRNLGNDALLSADRKTEGMFA